MAIVLWVTGRYLFFRFPVIFQDHLVLRTMSLRFSGGFVLTGIRVPVKRMPESLVEEEAQVFVYDFELPPTCEGRGVRRVVRRDRRPLVTRVAGGSRKVCFPSA